jgi:transposase InsO family protein
MKLTISKLLETLRVLNEGSSKYQARKIAGITKQRVYQVWNAYQQTGEAPEIGKRVGRPARPILEWERKLVLQAYTRYRVSADLLERLIERDSSVHIPHNHIHKILVELSLAKPLADKVVRKKVWIRYERRHSLTAVHIDWHQRPQDGPWTFAVEDDASRKLLALLEASPPTTGSSMEGMDIALAHGPIRQCIMDHGAQFISNIGGDSRFQSYLTTHHIQPILCRIKHPQSNGKVEKWFDTYERHRDAFGSAEEFITWYNEVRPHRSLNLAMLETPSMAFERKKKAEA